MEDKQEKENKSVNDGTSIPSVKSFTLSDIPEISQTREILLILNAICFGFAVGSAATITFEWTSQNSFKQDGDLFLCIIFILFYGFGLVVTYKYSFEGLGLFMMFCFISISGSICLFISLFPPYAVSVVNRRRSAIQLIVFFDVMVIILRFGVKLIDLMIKNEHLIPK